MSQANQGKSGNQNQASGSGANTQSGQLPSGQTQNLQPKGQPPTGQKQQQAGMGQGGGKNTT